MIIVCIRGNSERSVHAQFTIRTSEGHTLLVQGILRYGENYLLDPETGRLELHEENQFDA